MLYNIVVGVNLMKDNYFMYNFKSTIFLDLTKNQKSSLLGFLKSFVKKHNDKSTEDIIEIFVEDERYYYEQGVPHFEWVIDEFEKDEFLKHLKMYIDECKKQIEIKEAQKPFVEKQKKLLKEQRQKAKEFKLSKEPPTKKQLYYYDKLCKKYKLEKEDINTASRLDLMKMIERIVDEHKDTEIIPRKPIDDLS